MLNAVPAQHNPASLLNQDPHAALLKFFGFKSFLPQQENIVRAILNGEDVLAIMATSAGKSLCFQLPALMQPSGVTIVICPMVSLMNDQVINLRQATLNPDLAVRVHSYQSEEEKAAEWDKVISGKARLLYLSPETLRSKATLGNLAKVTINGAVIDEAHCATIWGHDFRPDYLEVAKILRRLGVTQTAAFTATAPHALAKEIIRDLGIPSARIILGDINRPNLALNVSQFVWRHERDAALIKKVQEISAKNEKVVIYCSTISGVQKVYGALGGSSAGCGTYHGQLDREERHETETSFRKGQIKTLIATKAFGMGIDNSNIRHVIHADMPSCLEDYCQEVGRAGRDGQPSFCHLMFCKSDYVQWTARHVAGKISADFVKHVYDRLVNRAPEELWKGEGPYEFNLSRNYFLAQSNGSNSDYQEKLVVAIGLLSELGVIDWGYSKITFMKKPEDCQGENFPITPEVIAQRFSVKMANLDVMYYFATQDDRPAIIQEHFEKGTVIERAKRDQITINIDLPADTKEILLELIDTNSLKVNSIEGYLSGHWRKLSSGLIEHFSRYHLAEYPVLLHTLEKEGLITRHVSNQVEYWAITEEGRAFLEQCEDRLAEITTYDQLKEARYNPQAKAIYLNAVAEFVRNETEDLSPENRKFFYSVFLSHRFPVLDKTRSGMQLVTDYHGHKLAILKESPEIAGILTEEFLTHLGL